MKILNNANFSLNSSKIEANSDTIATIPAIAKIQQNQTPCKTAKIKVVFQVLSLLTETAPVRFADFLYHKITFSLSNRTYCESFQQAEFVARPISRNKTGNRTNKASRLTAVVEALPLPQKGNGNHLLITVKRTPKMLYTFLFTGSRLRITVFANNLAEAYTRLPLSQSKPVLIARLPVQGGIYA